MRDAVWVLQMKTKRQKKWTPADVFQDKSGAKRARKYQQQESPRLMFRVVKALVWSVEG